MDLPTAPSGRPGSSGNNSHAIPPPPPPAPIPPARGDLSKSRREALKLQERPPITLSNLCPIDKYYNAADKVMAQFKDHLSKMELDEAYIIGRRFALFSTISLPGHDYYKSPRAELVALRLKNQKDAQWVTRGLERIVEVMDKQEIERRKAEEERLRKQKEEEEKKRLEWEESMRQRLGAVSVTGSSKLLDAKEESSGLDLDMASKLEKLNALFPQAEEALPSAPPSEPYVDEQSIPPLPPPVAPPLHMEGEDLALLNATGATQQLKSNGATPWFAEAPPSYSDLFLDTLRTSTPSVSPEELAELERMPMPATPPKPKPAPRTPIRVLQRNCLHQLQSLQSSKQIEVIRLGTYQGRLGASNPRFDSTNGCAVISPLVVATHIYPQHLHKKKSSKYGIANGDINDIIDKRAPPILQTVRSKLGLNKHALIIPSDVHDYLVDEHILPQDRFVGVCGGDILSETHIGELVNMLVNGKDEEATNNNQKSKRSIVSRKAPQKKVGAALFFREHVISIVKIPLGNGACYFDLIDSLPSSQTGGMASRTRCKDLASFEVLLRWYASSKFSESNCNFIENNEWDDGMCDFDPRVFQGFVWAE